MVLEEGDWVTSSTTNAEIDAVSPKALVKENNGWVENGWPWTTRNVGGGTVFYGGASFRYLPVDFDVRRFLTAEPQIDFNWPISASELADYYEFVEHLTGVTDRSSAAERKPSAAGELLIRAAEQLNWHWTPTPLAIDFAKCDSASRCITYACPTGAKADVARLLLRPLVESARLVVRANTRGLALETELDPRRVSGLVCMDYRDRSYLTIRAKSFVLACNAIQTAGLLLRSQSTAWPYGLGNANDLVGRTLCLKCSEYVCGIVPRSSALLSGRERLGPFSTVAILEHYIDTECPTGLGGLIYEAAPDQPHPNDNESNLLLRVETIIADHPRLRNRVCNARERDHDGMQKLMLDYDIDPLDQLRLEHMVGRCKLLLRAAGATCIWREPSDFTRGSAHLHGTCRSGLDPARSVVDPFGRLHEVSNLFVADGSFMPFPGGVNPTLTIQANASRIAEHLVRSQFG